MGAMRWFALVAACVLAVVAVEASVQPTAMGHALMTESHNVGSPMSALYVGDTHEIIVAGDSVKRASIFDSLGGRILRSTTTAAKVLAFDIKIPGTFLYASGSDFLEAISVGDGISAGNVVDTPSFPTNCKDMALSPTGDLLVVLHGTTLDSFTWNGSKFVAENTQTVTGVVDWITWMGDALVAMGGSLATAHVTEYSPATLQPTGTALYDDQKVTRPHAPAVGPDGLLYFLDEIGTNQYAVFTTDMSQATPTRFGSAVFAEVMKEAFFALRRELGVPIAIDSVLVALGTSQLFYVGAPTTCSNTRTEALCDAQAGCMWCASGSAQCYPLGTQCLSVPVPLRSSNYAGSPSPSGFLWDEFYGRGVYLDAATPNLAYITSDGTVEETSAALTGASTQAGGLSWDPLRDRTALFMDNDIFYSQLPELTLTPMSTLSGVIDVAPTGSALSATGDGNYVYYAEHDGADIRRASRNGNVFDSDISAASLSAGEGVSGLVALQSQGVIVAMAKSTVEFRGFRRVDSGDDALMVTGSQVPITPKSPVMGPGGTLYFFNVDSSYLEYFDPLLSSESYPVIPTVLSTRFSASVVVGLAFDALQSSLLVLDASQIHRVSLPYDRNMCLELRNEDDCVAMTGCHWCDIPEHMISRDSPCLSTTAVCPADFVTDAGGPDLVFSGGYDGACQLLAPVATIESGPAVGMFQTLTGPTTTPVVLQLGESSSQRLFENPITSATAATLDHNHKGRVLFTKDNTLCVFNVDDSMPSIPCTGTEANEDTIDGNTIATFTSLCMSGAGGDLYAAAGNSIFKYAYSGGALAADATPFYTHGSGNTITSMTCGASGRVYFTLDGSSTPASKGVYWVESDGITVVQSAGSDHSAVELGPDSNLYTLLANKDLVRWDLSTSNLDTSYVVAMGGGGLMLGSAGSKIAFHTMAGELLVYDNSVGLHRLPFFSSQCSQHHSTSLSCVQTEGCTYCASTKLCVSQTQLCPVGGIESGLPQEFLQTLITGDPSGLLVAANGLLVAAVEDTGGAGVGGILLVDPSGIEVSMKIHDGDVFDIKRDTHPDYPNSMLAMTDGSIVRFELGHNTGDARPNLLGNTITLSSASELVQSADGLTLFYTVAGELFKAGWDADLGQYTDAVLGPVYSGGAPDAECLTWDRSSSMAVVCVRSVNGDYTFQHVDATLTTQDFYLPNLEGVKSIAFGPDGKFYIWLAPQFTALDQLHVYDPATLASTVVFGTTSGFDGYLGGAWNVPSRVMYSTSVVDDSASRHVRTMDAAVGGCVDTSEETCNDHIACYWCEAAGACQHSSQLCGELLECSMMDQCLASENFYCDGLVCRPEGLVDGYCDLTGDTCATNHYCDGHNCQPEGDAVVGCDGQTDVCAAGFECCSTLECKEEGSCGASESNSDGGDSNAGSSAVGDPHFEGLHGGWFDFHGHADRTYSLVSTPSLQLNAHFVYSDAAYAGTYMDSIGLQLGEHTRIAFHRNGSVAIEPSFARDATGVMHLAGGGYARSTNETLTVFWDVWRIELNKFWGKRGRHTVHNERAAHVGYRLALDEALLGGAWDALQVHGVHGQTARTLGVVASRGFQGEGVIEGGEADYVVRDGLFGRASTFGLFAGAPATTRMPHEFGTSADGADVVRHEAVHVSAF